MEIFLFKKHTKFIQGSFFTKNLINYLIFHIIQKLLTWIVNQLEILEVPQVNYHFSDKSGSYYITFFLLPFCRIAHNILIMKIHLEFNFFLLYIYIFIFFPTYIRQFQLNSIGAKNIKGLHMFPAYVELETFQIGQGITVDKEIEWDSLESCIKLVAIDWYIFKNVFIFLWFFLWLH